MYQCNGINNLKRSSPFSQQYYCRWFGSRKVKFINAAHYHVRLKGLHCPQQRQFPTQPELLRKRRGEVERVDGRLGGCVQWRGRRSVQTVRRRVAVSLTSQTLSSREPRHLLCCKIKCGKMQISYQQIFHSCSQARLFKVWFQCNSVHRTLNWRIRCRECVCCRDPQRHTCGLVPVGPAAERWSSEWEADKMKVPWDMFYKQT